MSSSKTITKALILRNIRKAVIDSLKKDKNGNYQTEDNLNVIKYFKTLDSDRQALYLKYVQSPEFINGIKYEEQTVINDKGEETVGYNVTVPMPDDDTLDLWNGYLYSLPEKEADIRGRIHDRYTKLRDFINNHSDSFGKDEKMVADACLEAIENANNSKLKYWEKMRVFADSADKLKAMTVSMAESYTKKEILNKIREYKFKLDDMCFDPEGIARYTAPDEAETINERRNRINDFVKIMEDMRPSHSSDEWKAMEASLKRVQEIANSISTKDMEKDGNAEAKRLLNGAMKTLRRTAHNYAVHKVRQGKLNKGKNEELLNFARTMEAYANYDIRQLHDMQNMADSSEVIILSAPNAKEVTNRQHDTVMNFVNEFEGLNRGSVSAEFKQLKKALLKHSNNQFYNMTGDADIKKQWNNYMRSLQLVINYCDIYLDHKQHKNDGNAKGMQRMELAVRLRNYFYNVYSQQLKPNAPVKNPYARFAKYMPNYVTKQMKATEPVREVVNAPAKEAVKEPVKVPAKEAVKAPVKMPAQPAKAKKINDQEIFDEQVAMVEQFKMQYQAMESDERLCDSKHEVTYSGADDNGKVHTSTVNYYTGTNIPKEILVTGDKAVINAYLREKNNLTAKEVSHLKTRILVMDYLDKLEQYYNAKENKPVPTGPLKKRKDGYKVLPLKLDRLQDTSNGCWSCAYSIMLQSRGVNVDPALIRKYRPKLTLGEASLVSEEMVNTANADYQNTMFEYASLADKLCPNTVMKRVTYINGVDDRENILNFIKNSLYNNNAPVAFTDGSHWRTITGYNEKTGKFLAIDSSGPDEKVNFTKEIDMKSKLDCEALQFVAMEELKPNKDITIGTNGEIISNYPMDGKGLKQVSVSEFATAGTGFTILDDEIGHWETYYPSMKRNFDLDYTAQKEAAQSTLRRDYKAPADNGLHFLTSKAQAEKKCIDNVNNYISAANMKSPKAIISGAIVNQLIDNLCNVNNQDLQKYGATLKAGNRSQALAKRLAASDDFKEFIVNVDVNNVNVDAKKLLESYKNYLSVMNDANTVINKLNDIIGIVGPNPMAVIPDGKANQQPAVNMNAENNVIVK